MGWGGRRNNILLRPWKKKLFLVNKWIQLLQRMAAFWRKRTLFWKKQNSLMNLFIKTGDCKIEQLIKEYPKLNSRRRSREFGGGLNYSWRSNMCTKENEERKKPRFWCRFFKVFWKKRLDNLVMRAINDGFDKGEMSPSQKEGIIICIPNGDKLREYLKKLETYFIVEYSV